MLYEPESLIYIYRARLVHWAHFLHQIETVGVDVNEWKFVTRKSIIDKKTEVDKEIEVSATLWDFAGQDEYYPCHQFFFSGKFHLFSHFSESALILLLFDMSAFQKDPIKTKKRVSDWSFTIRSKIQKNEHVPVILIGTHLDQLSHGTWAKSLILAEEAEDVLFDMNNYLKEIYQQSNDVNPLAYFGVDCISGKNSDKLIHFITGEFRA